MSFGCKISSGSEDSSCQIFEINFSLLKVTFLNLSDLKACNSKTIEKLEPKLFDQPPTLIQAFEKKLVDLT